MRAAAAWCVALVLLTASAVLVADDHSVIFDEDVDFSTFKTYTIRAVRITSARPELNFPAVAEAIDEAIRESLLGRGLKATERGADLIVECQVTSVDFNIGPWGYPSAVSPGGRGRGRGGSPGPVDFTEVTLVLDLLLADTGALVFRGVYHDEEKDAEKLVQALPKDTKTLLSKYPGKKKE